MTTADSAVDGAAPGAIARPAPPLLLHANASGLLLADDLLVLFGQADVDLLAEAAVRLAGSAGTESPSGTCWCRHTAGRGQAAGRPFVALARLADAARAQVDGLVLVVGQGDGRPLHLAPLARLGVDPAPLALHVAASGLDAGMTFGFLAAALLHGQGAALVPSQRARSFLGGLLQHAGDAEGFVEVLATPECGGLLIQGWCAQAPSVVAPGESGELAAVAEGEGGELEAVRIVLATFSRDDVLAPARGIVGFARTAGGIAPEQVRAVHLADGARFRRLEVTPAHRVVLEPAIGTVHLRRMLPQLNSAEPALRALRRTCRPRFPGADTISASPVPTRAAKDLLLGVPGAGFLLAGWLLDPEARVQRVLLKSDRRFYARLDQRWARRHRPDVSQGFMGDPLFAGRLSSGDDLHGFLVHVPGEERRPAGERFHLEFVLKDGDCLFLPLEIDAPNDPFPAFRDFLARLQPDDPVLEAIAREHLGPVAGPLLARRKRPRVLATAAKPDDRRAAPELALIVAVEPGADGLLALLALLADEPCLSDGRAELVLVAAEPEARQLAPSLSQLAAFYGVEARLLPVAAASVDTFDALALGAEHTTARLLLFLDQGALPERPGWIDELCAGFAALPGPGALSPTLVHEDGAPRYGGGGLAAAGCPTDRARRGARAVPTLAGQCMLIDRCHLAAVGGFPRDLADPDLVPTALARKLAGQGIGAYWLPGLRLAVADPAAVPEPGPERWRRIAALLDGHALARRYPAPPAGSGTGGRPSLIPVA